MNIQSALLYAYDIGFSLREILMGPLVCRESSEYFFPCRPLLTAVKKDSPAGAYLDTLWLADRA